MSEEITLFGIPNCDSTKKARNWLDRNRIAYKFHDYKKSGIDRATLDSWAAELGWQTLLNRRGMTWRKLPAEVKASIDRESAIRLMLETPSIIKRPVLDTGEARHAGFTPEYYDRLFA